MKYQIFFMHAYSYGVLFLGFITMATNTTSHVSYISIVSHLEDGKSPESTSSYIVYDDFNL